MNGALPFDRLRASGNLCDVSVAVATEHLAAVELRKGSE